MAFTSFLFDTLAGTSKTASDLFSILHVFCTKRNLISDTFRFAKIWFSSDQNTPLKDNMNKMQVAIMNKAANITPTFNRLFSAA